MKRPTAELWLRQERLARYREKERLKRGNRRWIPPAQRYAAPGELIRAPEEINLTRGAGVQVVKFLRAVAHTVLQQQKPVRVDFRLTESLYAPGAILLFPLEK